MEWNVDTCWWEMGNGKRKTGNGDVNADLPKTKLFVRASKVVSHLWKTVLEMLCFPVKHIHSALGYYLYFAVF